MSDQPRSARSAPVLLLAACFVVVVAGMKAASTIIVPFILAMFIAVVALPPMTWMQRRKVPSGVAVVAIIICIVAVMIVLGMFVGASLTTFAGNLSVYEQNLAEKTATLATFFESVGIDISQESIREHFNAGAALKMVGNTLAGLSGVLTNAFLIILTVVFILLEAAGLPLKLRAALSDPEKSLDQAHSVRETVNQYMALKTLFSFVTGVLVYIWLRVLGVDYPLLWGLLAFLLNFIPNIGSIIAAIPPTLLAVVQFGFGRAGLVILGYLVVNFAIGSVVEPKFMGKGLGLSTLVVFISLVFWGWVLGPVGMLLSVPLTMVLKIALEGSQETRWMAVMLGSNPGEDLE